MSYLGSMILHSAESEGGTFSVCKTCGPRYCGRDYQIALPSSRNCECRAKNKPANARTKSNHTTAVPCQYERAKSRMLRQTADQAWLQMCKRKKVYELSAQQTNYPYRCLLYGSRMTTVSELAHPISRSWRCYGLCYTQKRTVHVHNDLRMDQAVTAVFG